MTKNTKRALFLIVATVANMVLTILIIFVLVAAWSVIAGALKISQNAYMPAVLVSFVAAVILAGFIYNKVLKGLRKRPDLEERFGLRK